MVSVAAQWRGVFTTNQDDDGWTAFNRLDDTELLPPATDNLARIATMPAGVRAQWTAAGGKLFIEGEGDAEASSYDVLVNGRLAHRLPAVGSQFHEVDLGQLQGGSSVELWLPQFGQLRVRDVRLEGVDVALTPARGARWVTYGSSITHCREADGPSETWPALVARENGWRLTSLGFAGECYLDDAVSSTIAATGADLISLSVGINVYNAGAYSPRTYPGAVRAFLKVVRDGHPQTPIAMITPVLSVPREEEVGPLGWTLSDYRKATVAAVRRLQAEGDDQLHLIDGAAVFSPAEAEERMPDSLHPDTTGYRLMAERLGPQLAELLYSPAGSPLSEFFTA